MSSWTALKHKATQALPSPLYKAAFTEKGCVNLDSVYSCYLVYCYL